MIQETGRVRKTTERISFKVTDETIERLIKQEIEKVYPGFTVTDLDYTITQGSLFKGYEGIILKEE